MKKIWLLIVMLQLANALIDIFIWQRIFEADYRYLNVMAGYSQFYIVAWLIAFYTIILAGIVGMYRGFSKEWLKNSLFFAGASITLAHSGLEDILYYWLDGKAIHPNPIWLDKAPLIIGIRPLTDEWLIISALIWISFWLLMTIWMVKTTKRV